MQFNTLSIATVAFSCGLLSACGGSSDNDAQRRGDVSVGVTDAAVDGANRVVVEFEAVELKPQGGKSIFFELDAPQQIDLLDVQGMEFEPLIMSESVPAGPYNWIRLHVNDNDCAELEPGSDPSGSFIELEDGSLEPLHIPSGSQSSLKLVSGFTVAAGGQTDVTIDFDVRKSVTAPEGQDCHFLKPALRLVDNAEVGHISGTVDPTLLEGENCSDVDPLTGNAVYLFEGFEATLDDIDSIEPEPITSALVSFNEGTGEFDYEIGFVLAGDYTVALSCNADLDDPEVDNPEVTFEAGQDVTVTVDQVTTADF